MEETKTEKPDWVKMKPAELEKLIIDLGKQGESPSKIGMLLRDKHGIPKAKLLGKRITHILNEAKIKFKTDKEIVQAKIKNIERHSALNHHDHTAHRAKSKHLWVVHKLEKQ